MKKTIFSALFISITLGTAFTFSMDSFNEEERLLNAIISNDHLCVKELLEKNPKLCFSDFSILGYKLTSPLHLAIPWCKEDIKIPELLLNYGVNIDLKEHGLTPLHRAAIESNASLSQLLLEHGADVDAVADLNPWQGDGYTALHLAVERNGVKVGKVLLVHGANKEAYSRGWNPEKPLHSAASRRQWKSIKQLLKYGANPLSKTPDGRGVIDLIIRGCFCPEGTQFSIDEVFDYQDRWRSMREFYKTQYSPDSPAYELSQEIYSHIFSLLLKIK